MKDAAQFSNMCDVAQGFVRRAAVRGPPGFDSNSASSSLQQDDLVIQMQEFKPSSGLVQPADEYCNNVYIVRKNKK